MDSGALAALYEETFKNFEEGTIIEGRTAGFSDQQTGPSDLCRANWHSCCTVDDCQSDRRTVRGVYPVGMSAANSGFAPRSGFTYSNLLAIYSLNEFRGKREEILAIV